MKIFRDTFEQSRRLPMGMWSHVRPWLLGRAKDPFDPSVTHKMSLIALLAWVGLGADGLSSSAYGPPEAYSTLVATAENHAYLAVLIALATAFTVMVISYSYSRIIEHFPGGGGGYLVATALLGQHAGVVSGCALLVDYVLTITVSIASGGDAIFGLLPQSMHLLGHDYWLPAYKLPAELAAITLLLLLNMRGVKESVSMLVPIFLTFLLTHAVLICGVILMHVPDMGGTAHRMLSQARHDISPGGIGCLAVMSIFLRAYTMGAGTYTGIEAVSNGLSIMREPRVETGKRTMVFMAASLSITAGGLLLCYLLAGVEPHKTKTLNTVLAEAFAGNWRPWGFEAGAWFVTITISAEAVLLLVAAQAGFIDGPRVMSNMATDEWLPHRFAALSEQLTMQNGILLMGMAAAGLLVITHGNVVTLVVMYSINVFVTFSLSQMGMIRFWVRERKVHPAHWLRHMMVHILALAMCFAILCVMVWEKFKEGAWMTIVITGAFICVCVLIRLHYRQIAKAVRKTDRIFSNIAKVARATTPAPAFDPATSTAVLLVKGYNGLGIHTLLSIFRLFPSAFKQVVFVSVGVVDSGLFKGSDQVKALEEKTREGLERYVQLAHSLGIPAKSKYKIGTDVVREASELCVEVAKDTPRSTFFAGEVLFGQPHWWDKFLHNDVAYAIQRRIRFVGLSMVVLPMLVQQFAADPGSGMSSPVPAGTEPMGTKRE